MKVCILYFVFQILTLIINLIIWITIQDTKSFQSFDFKYKVRNTFMWFAKIKNTKYACIAYSVF